MLHLLHDGFHGPLVVCACSSANTICACRAFAGVETNVILLAAKISVGAFATVRSRSAPLPQYPKRHHNTAMEIYLLLMLIGIGAFAIKNRDQRQRIALLGGHLQNYQLEKHMETLTEGYMRALGESDPARREQIWSLMDTNETVLAEQFERFAAEMAGLDEESTRVSKFALAIPHADRLFPNAVFDLRKLLKVHAQGIAMAVRNIEQRPAKDKAFTLSAEMYLMQHTCHWYCRSKAVASARLLARHKTSYPQVLASVSPETRRAYLAITGG